MSAQVVAQAESIRQAHYAQWEASRAIVSLSAEGSVVASLAPEGGGSELAPTAVSADGATTASTTSSIDPGVTVVRGPAASLDPAPMSGSRTVASPGVGPTGGSSIAGAPVCSRGACGDVPTGCSSGLCGGIGSSGAPTGCSSGACGGIGSSGAPTGCSSGACGGVASSGLAPMNGSGAIAISGVPTGCSSGACGGVVAHSEVNRGAENGAVAISAVPMNATVPITTVTAPGEWSQPSDATLRASADVAWVQPPDASLRANGTIESSWAQPFEARLEPVPVTTESRVAVAAAPPLTSAPPCDGDCAAPVDPALFAVPAIFQLMFNIAAVPAQQPQGQVHGARPVGR